MNDSVEPFTFDSLSSFVTDRILQISRMRVQLLLVLQQSSTLSLLTKTLSCEELKPYASQQPLKIQAFSEHC